MQGELKMQQHKAAIVAEFPYTIKRLHIIKSYHREGFSNHSCNSNKNIRMIMSLIHNEFRHS